MVQAASAGRIEGTFSGTTLPAGNREAEADVGEISLVSLWLAEPALLDKVKAAPGIF